VPCSVSVYFSPHGGAERAIIRAVDNAKNSVLVQAYSFTSEPIADVLIRALRRGLDIRVLLDKSQTYQKYSCVRLLLSAGIPTYIDASHAIAHNKVMIIDNEIVIKGSFNFTRAAEERNAENLLIVHSRDLSARCTHNWHDHEEHSQQRGRTTPRVMRNSAR
jgi:phosphatidylserine/phosphatidylglycerophosphate/cardiolipin synthase-like enzyme